MSDNDALNNKVEQIEEHSHTNDETIEKIMNTYLTANEKNQAVDLLKSRIETLEAKNTSSKTIFASFEARIAALENLPLDWKNDYSSFIQNITETHLKYFRYNSVDNIFQIEDNTAEGEPVADGEYLKNSSRVC